MDKKKLWTGVLVGLLLVLATTFFTMNGQITDRKTKQTANTARITDLTKTVEKARTKKKQEEEHPPVSEEEEAEITYSAGELGRKVAELQNAYATTDPADSAAFDANVAALDACFGDSDKNARTPWYGGDAKAGSWTFVTDGIFSGTEKHVLWLCLEPETDALLAYATGTYHADTDTFGDVSWNMSYYASGSVGSSGTPPETTASDAQNMADAIANMEVPEATMSDEQISDIKDAQEWLREQMKDERNSAYLPTDESGNGVEDVPQAQEQGVVQ